MAYYHVTKSTSPKLFRFHFKISFQNYFPMPFPVPPGEGFNMAAFHTAYRIIHENHSHSFSISKKNEACLVPFSPLPRKRVSSSPSPFHRKTFPTFPYVAVSPNALSLSLNEEETSAPGLFAPASVFPLPRRFRESPLFPENAASQKRAGIPRLRNGTERRALSNAALRYPHVCMCSGKYRAHAETALKHIIS